VKNFQDENLFYSKKAVAAEVIWPTEDIAMLSHLAAFLSTKRNPLIQRHLYPEELFPHRKLRRVRFFSVMVVI
jgi:hypothetical protein